MTYAQPVIARSFFKNRGLALAGLFALVGCGDAGDASADTDDADPIATTTGAGADVTGSNDGGVTTAADDSSGEPPATAAGHCDYTSPFTQAAECREYTGSGWTGDEVQTACDQLMGAATLDALCSDTGMLGRCVLDGGTDREVRIVSYGDDPGSCASSQTGCETFGGGTWEPEGVCSDAEPVDTTGGGGVSSPFVQPTLECRDPIDGEPAGNGPDGQVCTWQLISASTEEGRHYEDYADCDIVYTQRPYYPVAGNDLNEGDMRMEDAAYTAELDWVREQIEASACVCCHSDVAPAGASNWTIDAPGNWIGTFDDSGLAFSAGWIDSSSFGMFSPEDNNGFDRTYGIPSTDPERMRDFFIAELDNRGLIEADFADDAPFGGPLYSQLIYEPSACENGEGVAADGTVNWEGGAARYVYVLEAGSGNPTVPPNLDLPDGTLWRIDVPSDEEDALQSGAVTYGDVPAIANQRVPAEGGPAALVEGEQYYLYVLADVVIPVTRCVFTY
ncbi:MAG: hypothetical protein AAGA54_07625 [Myxococcota bacterium]